MTTRKPRRRPWGSVALEIQILANGGTSLTLETCGEAHERALRQAARRVGWACSVREQADGRRLFRIWPGVGLASVAAEVEAEIKAGTTEPLTVTLDRLDAEEILTAKINPNEGKK